MKLLIAFLLILTTTSSFARTVTYDVYYDATEKQPFYVEVDTNAKNMITAFRIFITPNREIFSFSNLESNKLFSQSHDEFEKFSYIESNQELKPTIIGSYDNGYYGDSPINESHTYAIDMQLFGDCKSVDQDACLLNVDSWYFEEMTISGFLIKRN